MQYSRFQQKHLDSIFQRSDLKLRTLNYTFYYYQFMLDQVIQYPWSKIQQIHNFKSTNFYLVFYQVMVLDAFY